MSSQGCERLICLSNLIMFKLLNSDGCERMCTVQLHRLSCLIWQAVFSLTSVQYRILNQLRRENSFIKGFYDHCPTVAVTKYNFSDVATKQNVKACMSIFHAAFSVAVCGTSQFFLPVIQTEMILVHYIFDRFSQHYVQIGKGCYHKNMVHC